MNMNTPWRVAYDGGSVTVEDANGALVCTVGPRDDLLSEEQARYIIVCANRE